MNVIKRNGTIELDHHSIPFHSIHDKKETDLIFKFFNSICNLKIDK